MVKYLVATPCYLHAEVIQQDVAHMCPKQCQTYPHQLSRIMFSTCIRLGFRWMNIAGICMHLSSAVESG